MSTLTTTYPIKVTLVNEGMVQVDYSFNINVLASAVIVINITNSTDLIPYEETSSILPSP